MTFTRGLLFILVGYAALLVTGSVSALLPWHVPTPEVTLLLVLYLGLGGRGSPSAFAGVALIIGYLTDLLSGAPRGLHALSFVIVMLLARGAANRLLVTRVWQEMLVSVVAALGHGALVVALAAPLYDGDAPSALRMVPLTALVTGALMAPLFFKLLRKVDRKLAPDPRSLRMPSP